MLNGLQDQVTTKLKASLGDCNVTFLFGFAFVSRHVCLIEVLLRKLYECSGMN